MNHNLVLSSDVPIPPSHGVHLCRTCRQTAQRFWPAIRVFDQNDNFLYNPAEPYCEVCLIKAKTALTIALGSQPPL